VASLKPPNGESSRNSGLGLREPFPHGSLGRMTTSMNSVPVPRPASSVPLRGDVSIFKSGATNSFPQSQYMQNSSFRLEPKRQVTQVSRRMEPDRTLMGEARSQTEPQWSAMNEPLFQDSALEKAMLDKAIKASLLDLPPCVDEDGDELPPLVPSGLAACSSQEPLPKKVEGVRCPSGHALVLSRIRADWTVCDICNRTIGSTFAHGCSICDFDVCEPCYTKPRTAAESREALIEGSTATCRLSQTELSEVLKLESFGYDHNVALEAYIICNRNMETTMNFLLENVSSNFEDQRPHDAANAKLSSEEWEIVEQIMEFGFDRDTTLEAYLSAHKDADLAVTRLKNIS